MLRLVPLLASKVPPSVVAVRTEAVRLLILPAELQLCKEPLGEPDVVTWENIKGLFALLQGMGPVEVPSHSM